MSISVIAHFNIGTASPFPLDLKGISGEGEVFINPNSPEGGVIVASFNTNDDALVINAYKLHLEKNDLSALALHRHGDTAFFHSETQKYLF